MALNFLNNIDLNKNQLLNAQIHNVSAATLADATYIASSVAGQLAYDTTNNVLKIFNGTAYVSVDGASGTVTSVTGTAPISVTSGNTPAVSISAATTSAAGTMSASDKTKLNAISGTNTGDQNISGIATNASAITALVEKNETQDTAIALNTAKTGITSTQASAIETNSAKVGITSTQASAITANTAKESNVDTNLSVTANGTSLVVNSSDGTNATLPAATGSTWGVLSDELYNTFNGKVNSNTAITGATKAKITFDSKGLVTGGANLVAADIPALDASKITTGTIAAGLLPSYVDDVLEYAALANFPATGETGKIYVATGTNKTYRWSGSTYVQITSGAVDTVSGRTGAVVLTKADVNLGNVDNTSDAGKPVSTATATSITAAISTASSDATTKANSAVTTAATAENAKTKVATILKASINEDGRAVTITHNFGSKNVVVQLFDAVTNLTVFADVERFSTNVVKVDFGRTPANNVVCLLTNFAAAGTITPTYA